MLVVAMVMHLCAGHCGNKSSCSSSASAHCSKAQSSYHHGQSSSCASHSKCSKGKAAKCAKSKSCGKSASCEKGKSCSGKSKCSKSSSCKKGEKVYEWKSEDGDKVIKKVITVDIEEEG